MLQEILNNIGTMYFSGDVNNRFKSKLKTNKKEIEEQTNKKEIEEQTNKKEI